MEFENIENQDRPDTLSKHFTTVTPFSKYFAFLLFVTLPFIGGYLGYKFSPEKVVEVEKIVEIEKQVAVEEASNDLIDTTFAETDLWERYIHPAGFALLIPSEALVINSKGMITVSGIYGYLDIDILYKENVGGESNLPQYIAEVYGSECEIYEEETSDDSMYSKRFSVTDDMSPENDCRRGKNTIVLYSPNKDLAVTWTGSMDEGNHLYMLETIHISTPGYGE